MRVEAKGFEKDAIRFTKAQTQITLHMYGPRRDKWK
jgi:hypothetical protein